MIKKIIMASMLVVALAGCNEIPKEALQLSEKSLQDRQMQTRRFDTQDEAMVLSAGVGVIQDLGFNLDESETDLGLLVGSKNRDATNGGQVALAVALALLGGGVMPVDSDQKMRVSMVTFPSENGDGIKVRVTFQRIVWNTQHQITTLEGIKDEKVYREFFSKLSKALFLEANEV